MNIKIVFGIVAAVVIVAVLLNSCSSIPKKATPVKNFDVKRYLGKWYEIARFDFKFEKNLNNVTAEYSLNDDGSVKVMNKGYDYVKKEWKAAEGKAKFRRDENLAALKVSFFGPFYSGYNVIDIDSDYQYALVAGKSLDYMWILSRSTQIPENIKERFLEKAVSVGYNISNLVWVEHAK